MGVFLKLKFEEQANLLSCQAISQIILQNDKAMIFSHFSENKQRNMTFVNIYNFLGDFNINVDLREIAFEFNKLLHHSSK